jgi:hypothetical protein
MKNETVNKQNESQKPPVGIKPRHLHDDARMRDIHAAMGRYIESSKQIPAEWTKEMLDLSKANFSK